ncbi:ferritin light chain 1-like [Erinaceus europaeus]|uniref:Ferritin n=1 Tax=Erinaceus europaeus TaxID=9365 RepID=A0A1S3AFM8_ERIEU|nr:ferritin light chain 1-like [Erinaceus europaeus]
MFFAIWKEIEDAKSLQFQALNTYSSLGLKLLEDADSLEEAGLFFCELSEEKQEGYFYLLELQKFCYLYFFNEPSEPDPDVPSWEGLSEAMEFAIELEKRLKQAVRILCHTAFLCGYSKVYDLLMNHLMEKEDEVVEQMQAHMGTVRSLAAQQEQGQHF